MGVIAALIHVSKVMAPWAAAFFSASLGAFATPAFIGLAGLVIGGAFLLYVYVPFLIAASASEGGRLVVSEQGIGFPPGLFGLGLPAWFSWKDLKAVRLVDSAAGNRLMLNFKQRSITIDQKKLEDTDLERVLIGVEVWAKSAVWEPAALEFKDSLQNANRGLSQISYSQLWQDELDRGFHRASSNSSSSLSKIIVLIWCSNTLMANL